MGADVFLPHSPEPRYLDFLRELLDETIALQVGPETPDPAHYDILVTGRPAPEWLVASPNLRRLVIPFTGIPRATREALRERPEIAVHNLHHNAGLTAEFAVTLLLAAAKRVVRFDREFRDGHWWPEDPGMRIEGSTALVLGCGEIGRRVARTLASMGASILAVRRHPERGLDGVDAEVHPPDQLRKLLSRARIVVGCLPETPETIGILDEAAFDRLPKGAVFVNVGRASLTDERALYDALARGRLGAAGLDVWFAYPKDRREDTKTPPSTFPFHELENLVMSPHRAGRTEETERVRMEHLATLLNAAARGETIPNRVDLLAGY